jgi:hypothetical protein
MSGETVPCSEPDSPVEIGGDVVVAPAPGVMVGIVAVVVVGVDAASTAISYFV